MKPAVEMLLTAETIDADAVREARQSTDRLTGQFGRRLWHSLRRMMAFALARPYVSRELPAWGHVYRILVGGFQADHLWAGQPERWVRGKIHGYEMPLRIAGWSNRATYFLRRYYDLPTQLLVRQTLKSGDTFVDIGANEGMIALVASRAVGSSGKVIAFEPNPSARGIFERTICRNAIRNIDLRAAGLSNEAGELPLFIPDINSGEATFTRLRGAPGRSVVCLLLLGDAALKDEAPSLIKIDVEGFEARVLRGLEQTLRRLRPVLSIELIAGHLKRDGEDPQSVIRLLREFGYEGVRLGLGRRGELTLGAIPDPWIDGDYLFLPKSSVA